MIKSISKKNTNRIMALIIVLVMIFSFGVPAAAVQAEAASSATDIQGHWAEKQIADWIEKDLAGGYSDGSFKPNSNITRAEFITLVNNAFKLNETASINFSDVKTSDWFYEGIAKAVKAGYISGYEDGTIRPNNPISRQEVAAIIFKLLKLDAPTNFDVLNKFSDAISIPQWSKTAVAALVENGIMGGYPDGTFQSGKAITRAESVATLDGVLSRSPATTEEVVEEEQPVDQTTTTNVGGSGSSNGSDKKKKNNAAIYSIAGTYGPETGTQTITGNVTISSADVTLQNTVITGNLVLAAGIGEGNVTLKGVTVQGTTTVNGGGANSIHFEDSILLTVIVNKNNGTVRIVATGSTSVTEVQVQSSARIHEQGLTTGSGFNNVTLNSSMPANADVELLGSLETVNTFATNVRLSVGDGSDINNLILNAVANIIGPGRITSATINAGATGSTMASLPTQTLHIGTGASATIGGEEYDESDNFAAATTLSAVDATLGSISLTFADSVMGVNLSDFEVTATLDGQSYALQNLLFNGSHNRITFTPVALQGNIGKTFEVTVAPAEDSTKIGGTAKTDAVTVNYGFEGRITDIYGVGVEGMQIKFREGATTTEGTVIATATTGKFGYYSINLEPGMYCGELVKDGYLTTYIVATSLSGAYNVGQNETAIKAATADEVKIVLTWGEYPQDLDSHLLGPTPDGDVFHTAFYDKTYSYNNELYVDLDWDDIESYGPETTTIRKLIDGKYRFFVHNYSNESTLSTSGAKIEVYKGAALLETYTVPTGTTGERYWLAFDMDVNGADISLTEIHEMNAIEPTLGEAVISSAPLADDITITNNEGAADIVKVTGLSEGDIVKLYDSENAQSPFATSVAVESVHNTMTFYGLDLGAAAGSLWVTVTSPDMEESERTEKSFAAEAVASGTVSGCVYDNGSPLAGVTISLTGNNQNLEFTTSTDGTFNFANVPEGADYAVSASKSGYDPASITIDVAADEIVEITFDLYAIEPETVVSAVYSADTLGGSFDGNLLTVVGDDYQVEDSMQYLVITFSDQLGNSAGNIADIFGGFDLTVSNTVYNEVYNTGYAFTTVAQDVYDDKYLYLDISKLNLLSGYNEIQVSGASETVIFSVYRNE
ncbi:MAG: S-layer homology domain-containing protein [Bacillota bacterium]